MWKIGWIIHEMFSCMGPVVWMDHRIQEISEAIEKLKEIDK